MLKILGCVVHEHDLRLVAMSAIICALGCCTTTTILMRAGESTHRYERRWLACAAILFGSSVWALHFVAMVAFHPWSGDRLRRNPDRTIGRRGFRGRFRGAARMESVHAASRIGRNRWRPSRSLRVCHALRRCGCHVVFGIPDFRPKLRGGLRRGQHRVLGRRLGQGLPPENSEPALRGRQLGWLWLFVGCILPP